MIEQLPQTLSPATTDILFSLIQKRLLPNAVTLGTHEIFFAPTPYGIDSSSYFIGHRPRGTTNSIIWQVEAVPPQRPRRAPSFDTRAIEQLGIFNTPLNMSVQSAPLPSLPLIDEWYQVSGTFRHFGVHIAIKQLPKSLMGLNGYWLIETVSTTEIPLDRLPLTTKKQDLFKHLRRIGLYRPGRLNIFNPLPQGLRIASPTNIDKKLKIY